MNEVNFALPKKNIVFILAGLVLLILGYALMTGGGTTDPNVFPEEQMFSFRRITIAPFLILLGFAVEVFAIMYVPKGK